MVSVEQAEEIIGKVSTPVIIEKLPLHGIVNRVLAEQVEADRDLPPYNRVAMDGFAIDSATHVPGKSYSIMGIQPAGTEPLLLPDIHSCIEVMTGAVLPNGADAVIRYEDGLSSEGKFTPRPDLKVVSGMNVHRRGSDAQKGDVLVRAGTLLTPAEVAVLASVGKSEVSVFSFPKTALMATGSELIPVEKTPRPYEVRQSNIPALHAAMCAMGWPADVYFARDDYEEVSSLLVRLLNDYTVLILSGGVSKGKFDYIPYALEAQGVKKLFHQVAQKPGKPFWFGMSDNGNVVFALPGNPVSTFLCFYRYIRPWMLRALHVSALPLQACLTEEVVFPQALTLFLPVKISVRDSVIEARPVAAQGSGDFVSLINADGFLELPAAQTVFRAGESWRLTPFRQVF
jgi:molybdopterin molybdotransferase